MERSHLLVSALILAASVLVSCNGGGEGSHLPEVDSAEVTPVTLLSSGTEEYAARVVSRRREQLKAPVDAVVKHLEVKKGQTLVAGQVIARLYSGAVTSELRSLQAAASRSEADKDRLAAVRKLQNDCTLRSPFEGALVSFIHVKEGDSVNSRETLVTIEDPSDLQLMAHLPLAVVPSSSSVTIFRDGTRSIEGRFVRSSDAAHDMSGLFTCFFEPAPGSELKLGSTLKLELSPAPVTLPALPTSSICNDEDGNTYVWKLLSDSTVVRVLVDLGSVVDGKQTIIKGLSVGERAVSGGSRQLSDGDKVSVR